MTYGIGRLAEDTDLSAETIAILEAMDRMGQTTERPKSYLVCRDCGQSGKIGEYPFSTNPDSGYCDDCM